MLFGNHEMKGVGEEQLVTRLFSGFVLMRLERRKMLISSLCELVFVHFKSIS